MSTRLTTSTGVPIDNDQASVTLGSGPKGYTLMQDHQLIEKLAHFNRERIPERVVHAKGAGAFGTFTLTNDMSRYTRAKVFNGVGKKTDLFIRFSTVGGERGSSDTARDPRGFAVKFYTEEGNYDIVGNNTPVFFIRDAVKFPDLIHSQKRNPQTNLPDHNMFWDFLSLTPESVHQVTILMSDRGTPKSYRMMDGFSSHAYMWYNANKEYFWVKYHFVSQQGRVDLTSSEASELDARNPNSCTEDLFNAIARGDYPKWRLCVQIMTPEQAHSYRFDPFDVTKVWYKKDFPLIEIGIVELNKNPTNYFTEVEQSAFAPSHLVPGIAASPDKLLQGRLFAYTDAHRWRLGANSDQIPVNAPRCPVHTHQRDGAMSIRSDVGPNYWPNSTGTAFPDPRVAPPKINVSGVITRHHWSSQSADFVQAGELYRRVLKDEGRAHLIANIVQHLGKANVEIQYRQCVLFYRCDVDYGTKVAEGLNLDLEKVRELASLKQRAL